MKLACDGQCYHVARASANRTPARLASLRRRNRAYGSFACFKLSPTSGSTSGLVHVVITTCRCTAAEASLARNYRYVLVFAFLPLTSKPRVDSGSIIHTDLKPENVLLDLPPRPPPESEQPPSLQGRLPGVGAAVKGVATTINDLSTALALADAHGLSAEEKRKLKKKVLDTVSTREMPQIVEEALSSEVSRRC